MIILTGGGGMIGSMIAWHLNTQMNFDDFVIVDDLINEQQENNFNKRKFIEYIAKDDLEKYLNDKKNVSAVIHMGAISATTESNFNRLLQSNIRFSQALWHWCAENKVPFIYASSAATYGDGSVGYDDNESELDKLSPLNAYGYSKHFFDRWVQLELSKNQPTPPQWCGLKFFNVYGPKEFFKGPTSSMVIQLGHQILDNKPPRLFHGSENILRDFIYIDDVIQANIKACSTKRCGVFNVGTGKPRSFQDIADILQNEMGTDFGTEYFTNPFEGYQTHTQANISSSQKNFGFEPKISLEQGIKAYIPEIKRLHGIEIK